MRNLILAISLSIAIPTWAFDNYDFPGNPGLYNRVTIFEDPGPGDSWFARAEVLNITGVYNEVETDSTTAGTVRIEYKTTKPNQRNDPNSADTACVVDLPDGVYAEPECVSVLEDETENIYLFKFLGM